MIERTRGDILEADAEALVNTVNCVGVMGRGVALQFRKAFPENYAAYKAVCERKELRPGRMFVFEAGQLTNPRYIINFPTKDHWKGKSRLTDIDAGLVALVDEVRRLGIRSIAIPPLGCGLGGLEWSDVRPRIERAFGELPEVEVLLYEPAGAPMPAEMAKADVAPRMTVGRAALLGLMNRYLAALMDPFVSLLEIHKLMYFMQEEGEPLRLRFTKAVYGPYAENLRHVLSEIEGHFIQGYADAGDAPDKQIELVPEALTAAQTFLDSYPATAKRFDRVVDLVEGFETSFGMELLATVHWVATRERAATLDQTIAATHAWNRRKQMFTPAQIGIAWDVLKRKGWLSEGADTEGCDGRRRDG
ncbi:Appr-1-p processing protein [Candidatus Defluviicoccus seviourii]|uniref:Appr-1-p processing protein n=2 Tax=root TaxID=1 RepID=A0A564WAT8_9PROT|nr:Appr-1-p processing protein [uncultured Defluviicoccus sp.]VUX45617.1 Appr-1-p processing protein [Candidatus Defluviicoccus seviourii]